MSQPVFSGRFDKVVIVLSTGRTGTMALARHFDGRYDTVRALHEPRPSKCLRIASNRYLCRDLSRDDLVRAFARSRRRLFRTISEPVYMECNNFLHGFLDVFPDLFENPLIVHVVRDPRTFIRSWVNFGVFRGVKGLVGRFHPYWLLKPDRYEARPKKRWNRMQPVERIAWYWTAINTELNRGERIYGDNYMRLRFEDIFEHGMSGLERLTCWIGLPYNAAQACQMRRRRVNTGPAEGFPAWEDWDQSLQDAVMSLCGELREKYGYDT